MRIDVARANAVREEEVIQKIWLFKLCYERESDDETKKQSTAVYLRSACSFAAITSQVQSKNAKQQSKSIQWRKTG